MLTGWTGPSARLPKPDEDDTIAASTLRQESCMSSVTYTTRFGSLESYEKGGVQVINDDVRHYAFSNCFEIAAHSKPYEKVVFGINQIYVLEVLRAEGVSPWFTCAHDE